MARSGLVRARHNRIDDTKLRRSADSLCRDAVTGVNDAVARRGVLDRAHDRRADRDDPATASLGAIDLARRRRGDPIRLIERQAAIKIRVAGR